MNFKACVEGQGHLHIDLILVIYEGIMGFRSCSHVWHSNIIHRVSVECEVGEEGKCLVEDPIYRGTSLSFYFASH